MGLRPPLEGGNQALVSRRRIRSRWPAGTGCFEETLASSDGGDWCSLVERLDGKNLMIGHWLTPLPASDILNGENKASLSSSPGISTKKRQFADWPRCFATFFATLGPRVRLPVK